MSTAKFNTLSNLAGTQSVPVATVAQGTAKAWVNFDGDITTPSIRGSFNVSSVTRNGTGTYVVNLTSALPDANGSTVGSCIPDPAGTANANRVLHLAMIANNQVRANTTSISPANSFNNTGFINVAVFR